MLLAEHALGERLAEGRPGFGIVEGHGALEAGPGPELVLLPLALHGEEAPQLDQRGRKVLRAGLVEPGSGGGRIHRLATALQGHVACQELGSRGAGFGGLEDDGCVGRVRIVRCLEAAFVASIGHGVSRSPCKGVAQASRARAIDTPRPRLPASPGQPGLLAAT